MIFRAGLFAFSCCAALLLAAPAVAAAAQEQGGAPTSLARVKERLETPVSRPLTPSVPVHLRPVFKSGVEKHPFVLTLDQDLHKTFDLNELQRQSAMWSARCCGIDLAQVYKAIGKSLYDRRVSQTREEIAKELAELQAARAAAGIK